MTTHQPTAPVPTGFWPQIRHQLARIVAERPDTFDGVRAILMDPVYDAVVEYVAPKSDPGLSGYYSEPNRAFFAGSGGDDTLASALRAAGWATARAVASYHYAMTHPATGDTLTYTEGDVTRGDSISPQPPEPEPADGTAERVASMAADAEEWAGEIFARMEAAQATGNYLSAEEAREELQSYGRNVRRVVSIVLAGGGPSHRLEVELDDDGDVEDVVSVASWGFEETRVEVRPGSALWRYAEWETEGYGSMEGSR